MTTTASRAASRARHQAWKRTHLGHYRPMLLALAEAGIPVCYAETDIAVVLDIPVYDSGDDPEEQTHMWLASPECNAELLGEPAGWTVQIVNGYGHEGAHTVQFPIYSGDFLGALQDAVERYNSLRDSV
ncbi:MAG TPA: hypothetical protein VNN79_19845 [Actinomycetota bacterium]|nr:hypothetical protein [Actinomycetota bacterium]